MFLLIFHKAKLRMFKNLFTLVYKQFEEGSYNNRDQILRDDLFPPYYMLNHIY